MKSKIRVKKGFLELGRVLILLFFLIMVLAPLYWLLISSFKTRLDIYTLKIQYWPAHFTFENYAELWGLTKFTDYLRNSIVVSLISAGFVLILSILGGYALSRYKFKGKAVTLIAFLITQMIPSALLIIPLVVIFGKLHLVNTLYSLIIFDVVLMVPFCLIMTKSFFERIPVVLEDAAAIDGCNKFQTLAHIVLPVMLPGIIAIFVFAFTGAWNELLGATMFINSESLKTIPAGISSLVGKFEVNWGPLAAGSFLSLIPTVIFFLFVQKYIIQGLTTGSVKE